MQVHHHIKYKEIHGVDEVITMDAGEHKRLHTRLRKEGKCNIPTTELATISQSASRRSSHLCKVSPANYDRIKKYGFAGDTMDTALTRALDVADRDKTR